MMNTDDSRYRRLRGNKVSSVLVLGMIVGLSQTWAERVPQKTLSARTVEQGMFDWDEVAWTVEFAKVGSDEQRLLKEAKELHDQFLQFFFEVSNEIREVTSEALGVDAAACTFAQESDEGGIRVEVFCVDAASAKGASRGVKGKIIVRLRTVRGALKQDFADNFKRILRSLSLKGWSVQTKLCPSSQGLSTYFCELRERAAQASRLKVFSQAKAEGWTLGPNVSVSYSEDIITEPIIINSDSIAFRGLIISSATVNVETDPDYDKPHP